MSAKINTISNASGEISGMFQSFYVEFFGTFIPGFIAVFSVFSLCLISAIYCHMIHSVSGIHDFLALAFKSDNGIKLLSSWAIFGVICAFSYAVGAIIYRRPPKIPDAIAAYRQWLESSDSERKALAVNFADLSPDAKVKPKFWWPFRKGEAIKAKYGSSIDYPYPHLRRFLLVRGLGELVKYVPWCADTGNASKVLARSKMHINAIKQQVLNSGNTALAKDLTRNESHIRLLSSLWYTFRFLLEMLVAAIGVQIVMLIHALVRVSYSGHILQFSFLFQDISKRYSFVPLAIFVFSFFFIWLMKRNIESCFHYVRTRELVMVLNAAEIVCGKTNDNAPQGKNAFIENAIQRNDKFSSSFCLGCTHYSKKQMCDFDTLATQIRTEEHEGPSNS